MYFKCENLLRMKMNQKRHHSGINPKIDSQDVKQVRSFCIVYLLFIFFFDLSFHIYGLFMDTMICHHRGKSRKSFQIFSLIFHIAYPKQTFRCTWNKMKMRATNKNWRIIIKWCDRNSCFPLFGLYITFAASAITFLILRVYTCTTNERLACVLVSSGAYHRIACNGTANTRYTHGWHAVPSPISGAISYFDEHGKIAIFYI